MFLPDGEWSLRLCPCHSCNQCALGFYSFPRCSRCQCDPAGTAGCDARGHCPCDDRGRCHCKVSRPGSDRWSLISGHWVLLQLMHNNVFALTRKLLHQYWYVMEIDIPCLCFFAKLAVYMYTTYQHLPVLQLVASSVTLSIWAAGGTPSGPPSAENT